MPPIEMKRFLVPGLAVGVVLLAALAWFLFKPQKEFTAHLTMESDAMAVVNYYNPRRIVLREIPFEANLRLPTLQSGKPLFGRLILGTGPDSVISVMLDEISGRNTTLLYIDTNNNEDLSDDGDGSSDVVERTYKTKEALVEVSYGDGVEKVVPYPVTFYRYNDRLSDSIIAYRNGYRKGEIMLGDSTFDVALFDDDLDGRFDDLDEGAMIIDLNRDGVLDGGNDSDEYFLMTAYFPVAGKTYQIQKVSPSGELLTVAAKDTIVFPKQHLTTDMRAPSFRTAGLNGDVIDLANYRNQVVLIDFWATWCKPWEDELNLIKHTYNKYHDRGFEIIGMNLDYDLEKLREYLATNQITWPQISDGTGWDMPLVELYKIDALPRSFLLGRRGIVRYKNLHARDLETRIYELLNEPEVNNE